ncbi:hypothetical protein PMAYCL1PPCAC_09156, partial [Pristionchus mayeri]
MRLLVLVSLALSVSALPRSVRKANWAALPADVKDENLDLLFAHAIWRHGDRAPEHAIPGPDTDKFTEDDWTSGGGGYGELTPEGMMMHFNLGRMLRKRYITETFPKFISAAYNAKEIYIRSTDFNRTLISAYANVQGMFSGAGEPDQNYPTDVPDWPINFVPIPVHTVEESTDFQGRPSIPCARQDQLHELVKQSPDYQAYINDPQVAQTLAYLSEHTGSDVNVDNIYELQDPFFCEKNHIDELEPGVNISDIYSWYYTGDVETMVDWIVDKREQFTDGTGNPGGINGVDVSIEIPKIRAGETLKLFVGNVHGVLNCVENNLTDSCRKFYKKLKYFALSAHDSTLAAFLTILGVKKYVVTEGYPNYSSALLLEVYQDKTTSEKYFKVLYHAGVDDTGKPITSFVRGCDITSSTCPIAVLDDLVAKYAPDTDMATLCATPPNGAPPSSTTVTIKPESKPTGASSTSTTTK